MSQNIRDRYINQSGARRVVQQGRLESEQMMDRYRRDLSNAYRKFEPSHNNLDMYRAPQVPGSIKSRAQAYN